MKTHLAEFVKIATQIELLRLQLLIGDELGRRKARASQQGRARLGEEIVLYDERTAHTVPIKQ